MWAPTQDFVANEPIDGVQAILEYRGDRKSVTVSGWPTPEILFEQLDGDLSLQPYGHILICPDREYRLAPSQPLTAGIQQRGTPPIADDPNAAYYDQYMYDGQFRLPVGAYRIYTGVSFNIGPHCTGDTFTLLHLGRHSRALKCGRGRRSLSRCY